jgi:hypothetical protein
MAQVVECLPSKSEALSSDLSNTHTQTHTHIHTQKKQKREEGKMYVRQEVDQCLASEAFSEYPCQGDHF